MKMIDIIRAYSNGEKTLEEANAELKEKGASYHLNPGKNVLTEEEIKNGTAGLLDSGTNTYDKVRIDPVAMEIVTDDDEGMGDAFALCFYQGKTYEVKGKKLVAAEINMPR